MTGSGTSIPTAALPFAMADPLGSVVKNAMLQVDEELNRLLASPDPLLSDAVSSVVNRPAKRMRPLIAILAALASGRQIDKNTICGAAALEALHAASLLHDDVLDESCFRGGSATPNASIGNVAAVLLGDFFFARSLRIAASIGHRCLERFLEAAEGLIGGEFGQAVTAGRLPTLPQYLRWIDAKTASLFALAATMGDNEGRGGGMWNALESYGRSIGMAYQLRDDLMDLIANEADLGKPSLNDPRRGLYTYAVIIACQADPDVFALFSSCGPFDRNMRYRIRTMLMRSGALHSAENAIRFWAERARQSLDELPQSAACKMLSSVADWIMTTMGPCHTDLTSERCDPHNSGL